MRRYHIAVLHISGAGNECAKGCTVREVGRIERKRERYGEEDRRERGERAWKSLEKLGESPRSSRFSLTRGLAQC